jgi:hypothetical protein
MPDERAAHARLNPAAEGAARHGIAAPRGQRLVPGSRAGRFGRMFPFLAACEPSDRAIDALVDVTAKTRSVTNPDIPAGYTYLAQFVDHDITFDPTSQLQRDNDPRALVNFRTPRFDLDSLYGSGPADQPFLYDWKCSDPGARLLIDHTERGERALLDLPRNRQGRALIGDKRNDENLILAQLHLLFIRFHNRVVDSLCACPAPLQGAELFEEAQRIVRWHYQWIVAHDLLARIVGPDMAHAVLRDEVRGSAPKVERRFYTWKGEPAIPVEFSGAAYRFGHSMVRPSYRLNDTTAAHVFPIPHQGGPTLTGFQDLPRTHTIQWDRFFFLGTADERQGLSMKIDVRLSSPLAHLPQAVAEHGSKLAQLNLLRGRALGLPSGQDVARAMTVEVLADDDLLEPGLTPDTVPADVRESLLRSTPLWFYILCEAQKAGDQWGGLEGGRHLGPVGGRIVAELLVGLLEADPHSYLRQWPAWTPTLRRADPAASTDDFTMIDLVAFAQDESEPRCP